MILKLGCKHYKNMSKIMKSCNLIMRFKHYTVNKQSISLCLFRYKTLCKIVEVGRLFFNSFKFVNKHKNKKI